MELTFESRIASLMSTHDRPTQVKNVQAKKKKKVNCNTNGITLEL